MADYGPTQNESAIIPTDAALWAFAGSDDGYNRSAWRLTHANRSEAVSRNCGLLYDTHSFPPSSWQVMGRALSHRGVRKQVSSELLDDGEPSPSLYFFSNSVRKTVGYLPPGGHP